MDKINITMQHDGESIVIPCDGEDDLVEKLTSIQSEDGLKLADGRTVRTGELWIPDPHESDGTPLPDGMLTIPAPECG